MAILKHYKRILYIGFCLIVACLIFVIYFQNKKAKETIQSGNLIKTVVRNIDCTIGKSKSRLYFKNSDGIIKHVNLQYSDCLKFNKGDTIGVFENKEDDWYEIDPNALK